MPMELPVASSVEESFFSNTDLLIAIADRDLVVTQANPRWREELGPSVGAALDTIFPAALSTALRVGGAYRREPFRVKRDGEGELWFEPEIKVLSESLHVVLIDITAAIQSLRAADEARTIRDLLLHDASVGTWLYDPDLELYNFSPELHRLSPLADTDLKGRRLGLVPRHVMDSFYHHDDLAIMAPMRERIVREGGSGELELRIRKPGDGGWDHLSVRFRSGKRRLSGLYELYGLTQTVTDLAQARDEARSSAAQITALATTDTLTGLPNRRTFEERLRSASAIARRGKVSFAVLFIDLDRFKEVNDTLGHQAGDALICEAGRRLASVARTEDTVARLGGDEFAVIQYGTDAAGAAAMADRVVVALSGLVELDAGMANLSCSVGIAILDRANTAEEQALRQADLALYRAKARGRGCYSIYEPEMDATLRARKALESDLRGVIARDGIRVAYQPIVSVEGEIVGVEALSRWTHPERGEIPPSVFIPLAEEADLISPLGFATFRRICEDSHRWPGVRVAVNVSPVQMRRAGFLAQVRAIVAETGADPLRFDFEITEGCLLDDDLRTQDVLGRLREMGFRLALDDFGTGYSSLSYLQKYPIDRIKLDRSFILQLQDGPRAEAIIGAIVKLAEQLDLDLVAEGVETQAQLTALTRLGVRRYQGFLFSRAVTPGTLKKLLKRNEEVIARSVIVDA